MYLNKSVCPQPIALVRRRSRFRAGTGDVADWPTLAPSFLRAEYSAPSEQGDRRSVQLTRDTQGERTLLIGAPYRRRVTRLGGN